jgi:PAS domain S-box-containing protein
MTAPTVPSAYNRYLMRGKALLPLTLVLLPLSLLALLPMVTMRMTDDLYAHIANDSEEARSHVWNMQHAIALESAATRAFLLTGDSAAVAHHESARAARQRAMREVLRLAPRLDEQTVRLTRILQAELADAEPLLDSLFAGAIPRAEYLANLSQQSQRLNEVLEASADVDRAIANEADRSLQRIRRIQTVSSTLTIVFVLMAVVAAAMVANLTRQYLESEGRFRQIAEALHDFVWLSDPGFSRHLFANEAYERIWGRPRAALYDNPAVLLEGVHPDDRDRVRHALDQLATTPYDIEFRVVRPDGDVRWVWSRAFPVRNSRGEVYRIAGITEDITERKLANESRLRLIRGFTHDVKNPLGAADGHLSLLDDGVLGALDPKQKESIGRVRRSIKAALGLVAQLLDIARAEAGQLQVERIPVDVAAAAREVVEEFLPVASSKQIELSVDFAAPAMKPPDAAGVFVIESDPARVRQVLANLISNAVKYTQQGGRVTVSGRIDSDGERRVDRWVAVAVTDNGPGIPYEKQNMLFREFTRLAPDAAQGSGIGLAISQRVARALDGKITFTSKPGAGSTFTFSLPATLAPTRGPSTASRDDRASAGARPSPPRGRTDRRDRPEAERYRLSEE